MWNPKRILLLTVGFALFFGVYLVYARFLGGIDGLPPLPQPYWPGPGDLNVTVLPRRQENAARRLREAFGDDCPEVKRSIRLEVAVHNLVLAAQDFSLDGGRVKLWPFSMAMFGKTKDGASWPEINTVRADVAYLEFDRPVNNVMEIGNRRIIGCELRDDPKKERAEPGQGGVTIVNNRGTRQRDDDVSIFTPGPIYYQENHHRGWTKNVVLLTDLQSKPKPTTISAVGMQVFLHADAKTPPPGKPPAGQGRGGAGVTGVERIVLDSEVNMHLWIDGRSGFLGGGNAASKTAPPKPTPDKEPERVQLVITTQGPFSYDLRTDRAVFDSAPPPNQVVVHRINEALGKREQLLCELLELQFQRGNTRETAAAGAKGPPPKAAGQDMQLEIKSARAATKTPNGQVAITSETENLNAIGNELIYNAETRLTVLKGSPDMVAVKDGNEIRARELRMKMDERSVTEVIAPGPGRIALLDREKGQRHLHAYWRDELTATREGTVDVLLLTGQARFEDQEQGQRIQADRLKVWLEPGPEDAKKPALKPAASDTEREAQRRRPRRLEARGHVQALSPDMRVRETESLVIHFADASLPQGPPAPSSPPPKPAAASQPTSSPASQPAVADTTKPTPEKPARPKSPLEVSAQFMEAYVLRTEAKNELDKLVCRGAVHVQQTPATPDDKEVDIRGDTLELTRRPEGNVLVVIGKVALVKLDKITMFGPVVTIDQTTNRATVVGTGAMTMPSNTTFEGGKLDKTTMLTVHWNESMFFEGRFAEFQGGVQALQDQSQVTCRTMQVELDREVSFRENAKGGETPKVHKVVCVETVRIEEKTVENGRITAHKKLSAKELALDNLDGRVHAGGPGWVRILQLGAKEEVLPTPGAARPKPVGAARPSAAKDEMELKLTRVVYQGRMLADNTNRTAFFFDNVEVVHLPAKEIDLAIDVDRLPAGAVHLQCQNTLKVYSSRDKNGKTSQVMEAYGRVQVRAQEFWGWADMVKYNEETDQLIFEAKEGNYASLHRVRVQGEDPQVIRGKKILYWRQSREYRVEGAVDVRGGN